eukprot:1513958-Rhodomonas_salina.1
MAYHTRSTRAGAYAKTRKGHMTWNFEYTEAQPEPEQRISVVRDVTEYMQSAKQRRVIYTPKSNTRNRIPGTNCAEIAAGGTFSGTMMPAKRKDANHMQRYASIPARDPRKGRRQTMSEGYRGW